jgi:hypothetical protein
MCVCLRHFLLCLCFLLSWAASQSASAQIVGEPGDTLTNAAQVRALTRAEAEKKVPVRVRGSVLECADSKFTLIDDSVGLYVEGPPPVLKGMPEGTWLKLKESAIQGDMRRI